MKLLNFLLLIFCIQLQVLTAQDVMYLHEPLFEDDKSLYELGQNNQVLDKVMYDGKFIYAKVKVRNDTVDYYRINDSIVYERIYSDFRTKRSGYYKLSQESLKQDTVITFSPETYEESHYYLSYHKLIKDGKWRGYYEDSFYWTGDFVNGLKEGRWLKSSDNIKFSNGVEYKNDIPVKYDQPDRKDIDNNRAWFVGKVFNLCSISFHSNRQDVGIETWWLYDYVSKDCQDFATITFKENGSLVYKHNEKYKISSAGYDGVGSWELKEEGGIIVVFKNGDKEIFDIDVLSQNEVRLKKSSATK